MDSDKQYTAFLGEHEIAAGNLNAVLPELKMLFDHDRGAVVLVFDDETGKQVDFDLRGTLEEVLGRAGATVPPAGPGRPKLGVVAREITLLPRHWEWLELQPGGASAAIRRLIDDARKNAPEEARLQQAIYATGRFLSAMAGNLPGYEEATRTLYRKDWARFEQLIAPWPEDVRNYTLRLVRGNAGSLTC